MSSFKYGIRQFNEEHPDGVLHCNPEYAEDTLQYCTPCHAETWHDSKQECRCCAFKRGEDV